MKIVIEFDDGLYYGSVVDGVNDSILLTTQGGSWADLSVMMIDAALLLLETEVNKVSREQYGQAIRMVNDMNRPVASDIIFS